MASEPTTEDANAKIGLRITNRVQFKINGNQYSVGSETSSDLTLLDFIRDAAEYRGTKYMCREGGCGACIVSAVKTPGCTSVAVNSCLVSAASCKDWDITTVEKIGNKLVGYHPIQTTLAKYNGTQCGYCTPGWVMAMFSLLKSKKDLTQLEIEQSFASNVCRCTGYRPILEAFKKFAKDSPNQISIPDIEDLSICKKTGKSCDVTEACEDDDWCIVSESDLRLTDDIFDLIVIPMKDGKKWFRVNHLLNIFSILLKEGNDSYMLVSGNTAKGAYPILEYPRIIIDISGVPELKGYKLDQNLIIGANTTLTEFIDICQSMSSNERFSYLKAFYDHLRLVAHIPVRNLGSIAGNLMIKHCHNDFPSDVFLLLETAGAQLTIKNQLGLAFTMTLPNFLKTNMTGNVITNILLPPLNNDWKIVTFKIMPRAQNAHAIVNAGFFYKLTNNTIVSEARIVYGGLSPAIIHATATERLLKGRNLFTNETLQFAINRLKLELIVVENPPELSAEYRKTLAVNLFYKGLLSLCPKNLLQSRYQTGSTRLHESRPVSEGRQIFDTDPTLWPLNQPIQKVEAMIQCSGEAEYSEDLPCFPWEVFATFALSTVPKGNIVSEDASLALKQPGVLNYFSAKDIPGLNSFTPDDVPLFTANEELLCNGEVKYFNQPIGIIVAESRAIAERAAKMVKFTYSGVTKAVVDINAARQDPKRVSIVVQTDATNPGTDISKIIKSTNTIYGQYHFMMENLVCVTKPTEEGLEVHTCTQHMDSVQLMTSRALKMDQNKIDVHVRRLGGAYGIKISRTSQVAVACNLVAMKLNRPCRFIQPLTTTMRAVGKRLPCSNDFEVAVNNSGVIQYVNTDIYEDNGYILSEQLANFGNDVYNNCYDKSKWNYKCYNILTDTASNTYCRSPGTLENIAMAEWVLEQISYELDLDPLEVRLANLDTKYNDLKEITETLKTNAEYTTRRAEVDKFNNDNRWKKKGLRFALLRWTPIGGQTLDVNMSVYHGDGTVIITHSGIEMGQGINTKAVQICAYLLKIPVEKIQIKANDTIIAPNGYITGGSITSQNVGRGVQRCCEQLLERLDPVRAQMDNPTWEELIVNAFNLTVDLQAHGFVSLQETQVYDVFGATLAEVEVDLLTGEHEVKRVDLIEDVGRSVNPEIDIGQVEGAFIMGLGYWTTERLVYGSNGEVLTDRTWHYHVPQAKEIPLDFRVYFRKKSYSTDAMFGAKASGEPPMCMSVVIPFAIREAIAAARSDSGINRTKWFNIDGPYTVEKICLAAETKTEDFKF